jgi:hypothetical protein
MHQLRTWSRSSFALVAASLARATSTFPEYCTDRVHCDY